MRGIEIFIDESGDFGPFDRRCPHYLVTMVFHESDAPLFANIRELEYRLSLLDYENHCVHTSPAIRGEGEYYGVAIETRRRILSCFAAFVRNAPLRFKCLAVEKKPDYTVEDTLAALRLEMGSFVAVNEERLSAYDNICVAYDKGQLQLSRLIGEIFTGRFSNVRITKTLPIYSRLFQMADYVCTMRKISLNMEINGRLAAVERAFFGSPDAFRKGWLKPLLRHEWK